MAYNPTLHAPQSQMKSPEHYMLIGIDPASVIMAHRLPVKPLSVNEAWQGRRFKTPAYKAFEKACFFAMPKRVKQPFPNKIGISLVFGVSNIAQDIDNPIKLCLDILCKKYGFNDNSVYGLRVEKIKVEKGKEFWEFCIEEYIE